MYVMVGKTEGEYLDVSKVYNLDYFSLAQVEELVEKGEILEQVNNYSENPDNPEEGNYYTSRFHLPTRTFEFEAHRIPPTVEERVSALKSNLELANHTILCLMDRMVTLTSMEEAK